MALRVLNKKYFRWLYELKKSWVVGLHFRQTTADDYDEVVSIRKHLYDGLDYIPSEYHDLLKHNTGIAGYIGHTMNAAIFKTTNHTLKRTALASDVQLSPLEIVDAKLLEKIILSGHAKHNLFPENRIVVKSVPYQLVVSNIDRIFNSNAKLFASFTTDDDQKCFNAPSLVSATTSTPCEAGTVIFLDFYGKIHDEELVTAHISKQMSDYLNTVDERLVLYVTYGEEHHIGTVQRLLSMNSWELTDSEFNYGIEETI